MNVYLLRHSLTAGNLERRYIGRTDEPLCPAGTALLDHLGPFDAISRVTVSPLQRARETAVRLFPRAEQIVRPGLRELDFGDFEGKNADEMADDPDYQAWVDSGCQAACPNGECLADLIDRSGRAFNEAVRDAIGQGDEHLVIVAHGGTVMAILSRYAQPRQPAFAWQVKPLQGYRAQLDPATWSSRPLLRQCRWLEVFAL
jgi:alpha-ribazole phosphatase